MTSRKGTRSWAKLLAVLLLVWMLFVPVAAMAGGEDDPGGMGSVSESALAPPPEDESTSDWTDWLLWAVTFLILP